MTADRQIARGGESLKVVLGLLRADAPVRITRAPQSWPRWAVLLPHVLAATGHFDRLPGQLRDADGKDASWLLDRAASYMQVHARFAEARPLAERALAITEAAHGPGHPDVVTLRANLDSLIVAQSQPPEDRQQVE
jgi:hypothetical protein